MKVKDILNKINDTKLYIEIKEIESGASYGINTLNDLLNLLNMNNLIYCGNNLKYKEIKSLNVQYIKGKRLLVLGV